MSLHSVYTICVASILAAYIIMYYACTCVMVYINDHRLYCILASVLDGISVLHSFLVFALLSKQLFRDFPVIM